MAPCWAAQENGKETRLWPIEWGPIYCSSVRSPTPSHTQPFQENERYFFSKEPVSLVFIVSSLWFRCICIWVYNSSRELCITDFTVELFLFIYKRFFDTVSHSRLLMKTFIVSWYKLSNIFWDPKEIHSSSSTPPTQRTWSYFLLAGHPRNLRSISDGHTCVLFTFGSRCIFRYFCFNCLTSADVWTCQRDLQLNIQHWAPSFSFFIYIIHPNLLMPLIVYW